MFFEWLYDINDRYIPDAPGFELVQKFFPPRVREVCLQAFIDLELGSLIDMEDSCNNYHCLPYEGGLLDQPILLLDAFNVIRGEKNKYERIRADKLMKNVDKK